VGNHYDDDDVAEAKQRANKSRKQTDIGNFFRPQPGTTKLRLLRTPGDKERNSPPIFIEYQVHRNVGPNQRFARCGNQPGETGKCWLCRRAEKLERKNRTKEAARLNPQLSLAVQVAVKDKEAGWIGPLLWEMGSGKTADAIGYKIRGVVGSERRDYTDPKRGYNIYIKRRGTGLKTKWEDIDHDEESSKVPKGIQKRLKPFVDTDLSVYDEEWQKDAYFGKDTQKESNDMPKKKKDEDEASDSSVSDSSSSDSSSSDSSSSDSSSSDSSDKKSKKKKKSKKDASDSSSSDSSSSDSSSSDSSSSDSSSSDSSSSDSSSSDSSSSDSSSSDASSSDSSSSDSSSSDSSAKKAKKRKPRSDKGKPRKTAKKKKAKK
jgi:hypothetical protein